MNIYIQKNNEQQGPFTLQEVNAKLAAGECRSEDPAWTEGWADWQSVSDVPGALCSPPPTLDVPEIPKPPQFRAQNMPPPIPVTPPPPTSKFDQYPNKALKQSMFLLACLGIFILAEITGYSSVGGFAAIAGFMFWKLSDDYLSKLPAHVVNSFSKEKLELITRSKVIHWISISVALAVIIGMQLLSHTVQIKTVIAVVFFGIMGAMKLRQAIKR